MEIDEIEPGLLLGDVTQAENLRLLLGNRVTHVLNCAKDLPCCFPERLQYRHVALDDLCTEPISSHFAANNAYTSPQLHRLSNPVRGCSLRTLRYGDLPQCYQRYSLPHVETPLEV